MIIAERIYTIADQNEFARLSGDCNPLHLDEVTARRETFGAVVVHGVHALLNSLEAYFVNAGYKSPVRIRLLEVTFARPIYLETFTYLSIVSEETGTVRLKLTDPLENQLLTINLGFVDVEGPDPANGHFANPVIDQPSELLFGDLVDFSGEFELAIDEDASRCRWPRLCSIIGSRNLADLVALTRMVGMKCPGMHSIFGGFKLTSYTSVSKIFRYHVTSVDERFSRVLLAFQGGSFEGEVETFFRPLPQSQISFDGAKAIVGAAEFENFTAWIIGGSRGIGEVAAKLISAGGGSPTITFHRGNSDANEIIQQIRAGDGCCNMISLDVSDPEPAFDQLVSMQGLPNVVLYFASPKIFQQKGAQFDNEIYEEFTQVYVNGLNRLYRLIRDYNPKHRLTLFHPSSSAIDDPVKGLVEYSAAKAAAEIMLNHIDRFDRFTSVLQIRLPRIATDQTATLIPFPAENAEDVLLPILRKLYRLSSATKT